MSLKYLCGEPAFFSVPIKTLMFAGACSLRIGDIILLVPLRNDISALP